MYVLAEDFSVVLFLLPDLESATHYDEKGRLVNMLHCVYVSMLQLCSPDGATYVVYHECCTH